MTSQGTTGVCNTAAVPASFPGTANCYLDITVNPKSTATQAITVSTASNPSINVLVAQISCIPGTTGCNTPTFKGLQALAVINADTTNPSVADPDFLNTDNDNPDVEAPYQNLPIAAGEEYFPTVDSPQDPDNGIFTPKISVPAIFTPKIGTVANSAPAIETPTIFTPKITSIFTPKITSVQVANPTIVNTIFTPKIFTPKIFTPKIVSPDIFTPKITNLTDGGVTDYSWKVNNKGNTSASYSTSEFAKSAGVQCCPASCSANNSCPAGCSVCQLVQHKLYDSPAVNRDATNVNPTCDLTVQENSITVANVPDPAFSTGTNTIGSASDPSSSTLSLSPGEGNRVTLRVVAPPANQTVSSFKTQATPFANKQAGSLTIATSALPVAVVGQSYTNTVLQSIGGFGTRYWTVPADPSNPVAVLPPPAPNTSEPLTVSPLTLSPSGQISTSVITATPGTYTVSFQVQDSAVTGTVNPVSTPALDVQQVNVQVNQFLISSVDVRMANLNQVGSIGYMKAGDVANVAVTVSSTGPANATSVTAGIQVNPVAAGTVPGAPLVTCSPATPASAGIAGTGTQQFLFTCTAISGNGFVTFTASANGHYVNAAADVLATATQFTIPPTGLVSQVIVDTVAPSLVFGATTTPQSGVNQQTGQIWYNKPVVVPYSTSDNLSGVASAVASLPATNTGLDNTGKGTMILSTEGTSITGAVTVSDFALNAATLTSVGYNIDMTIPTISGAVPQADQFGWYNTPVTVRFTCGDPNPLNLPVQQHSGVASCTSPTTLSNEGANQSVQGFAKDYAGNPANTTVSGVNIDLTRPTAAIVSPVNNAVYINNQPITATYTCADALSGVYTCAGMAAPLVPPVPSGTAFTQTVPGLYSFAVTATDKALNQSIAAVQYSTAYYGLSGFQSPLAAAAGPTPSANPPTTPTNSGSFVQGTTIPILWTLVTPATSLAVIDPATLTGLSAYPYNNSTCTGGIPTGNTPIQLLPASGLNSYTYDALTQRFQFLWNTTSSTPSCYYLLITFNDLSAYATNVIISPTATSTGLSLSGASTVDGNNSALPLTGSPVSMEAWVNLANPSSMEVFTYGQGYGLAVINQHVHFIGSTQDAEGSISIPTGQWTHIAVSYDGTTAALYVNGAIDSAPSLPGTGTAFATNNFAWRIGDTVEATVPMQPFIGMIDEVRVWSAARSAAQIVSDMTNELCVGRTGLVAYYKFNQGTSGVQISSGTLLLDVSSSQANGTINNSNPATPASWVQGAPALGDSLSIAVVPANVALSLTGATTQQFSANGSCTDGSTPTLSPLNWSASPPGVVTIDNKGLGTAQAQGNATVSSATADAAGTATVAVGP